MGIYDFNKNITEKKYRLKFLALIDTDNIVKIIKDTTYYIDAIQAPQKSKNALLHIIFDTIFSASSLYNQFLDYENPYANNFLGIPTKEDHPYKNRLVLLKLCLRNQCLIHGFFSSLHEETTINTTQLTAAKDSWNTVGYFQSPDKSCSDYPVDSTSTIYQNYCTTYQKRFKNANKSTDYSAYILEQCIYKNEENALTIPLYLKNPLVFLYKDRTVNSFNKTLQQTHTAKNILGAYADILSSYIEYEKTFENEEDLFLMQSFMEYIYGFSTLHFICQKLTQINTSVSYTSEMNPKDLEGEALNNILVSIMQCPLIYSRNFLLEHTYKTILDSDLSKAYLERNADVRVSYARKEANEVKRSLTALSLMNDFFRTINTYTVPLLEDLWDVVIYELNDSNKTPLITFNDYRKYIEQFRLILTSDYSFLTDDEIDQCICSKFKNSMSDNSDEKIFNIGISDRISYTTLVKNLKSHMKQSGDAQIYLYDIPASSYVKQSLCTIIKSSFVPKRFENRSEIDRILFSNSDNLDQSQLLKVQQFKINHAKELYELYL